MTLKFKRSLRGYDPVAVADKLVALDQEFTLKCAEMRQELAAQVHQRELLKIEVDRLKRELAAKVAMQNDLTERIVTVHLNATEKVINAMKDAEKNELVIANLISVRKRELNELSNSSSKMKDEFLALATYYSTILDMGKEGGDNV